MASALLIDAVVRDGDVHVVDALYKTRRQRAARKWGDGTVLKIRIEPEEDAAKHHHYKHLFGHLLTPAADLNGDTVTAWKNEMKARFLPDGMTSLTEMNAEQFDEFNRCVEECIREELPEVWDRVVELTALYH